jgi:hypothetical protein
MGTGRFLHKGRAMDKEEAKNVLVEVFNEYHAMSHEELVALIQSPLALERLGPSGVEYQIEIQAFWDEPRKGEGNLRVIASIDDGRFPHVFLPMTTDFIMKSDGSFVGE